MAKKIQKKQIEEGVFVEIKSTYTPPIADNEHVQKKYVDDKDKEKADKVHTHSWNDITDKPVIPSLPSWVTAVKPSYNWSEIGNKPNLDFIPLSWNQRNGKIIINTSDSDWLYINDNGTHSKGTYFGDKIVRTDGELQVGGDGNVFRTYKENGGDAIIIGDKIKIRTRENDDHVAFGNTNWTKLVYGEFAGIKIWNNVDNNKVVLAGGGVANLPELKNENIKIGGRNLALNSKVNVTNSSYGILSFLLSEEPKVGEELTVTIKGVLGADKRAFALYNRSGMQELCVLQNKGNGIFQSTFNWRSDPVNPKLIVIYVYDVSVIVNSTIEWIKIERGSVNRVDWTAAPEDLKVGGRNLIKDSNSFNVRSWNYNKGTHKGSSFVTPRGSQYANEATKLTFSGQEWDIFQKINFDESGSYVLSGWVKLETANNLLVVVNNSYSATAIFGKAVITGAGWQKFSIPLNVSGNLQQTFGHIHLGGYATIPTGEVQSAGDVLLWNLKLEKGVVATDWTPAPEDLDFYKTTINLSELNSFVLRDTGVYTVDIGGGYGLYLNFKNIGSTSSLEFFKRNWYAETRIGVRNSIDGLRFDNNNGKFRDLAWYEDVHRVGASISSNWTAVIEHQNNTIFVENSLNIELGQLQNMGSISFIKTFDGGNVTFTCAGKTVKYPFDNQFNGKDGSTAVATIFGNKCYIRISNV